MFYIFRSLLSLSLFVLDIIFKNGFRNLVRMSEDLQPNHVQRQLNAVLMNIWIGVTASFLYWLIYIYQGPQYFLHYWRDRSIVHVLACFVFLSGFVAHSTKHHVMLLFVRHVLSQESFHPAGNKLIPVLGLKDVNDNHFHFV